MFNLLKPLGPSRGAFPGQNHKLASNAQNWPPKPEICSASPKLASGARILLPKAENLLRAQNWPPKTQFTPKFASQPQTGPKTQNWPKLAPKAKNSLPNPKIGFRSQNWLPGLQSPKLAPKPQIEGICSPSPKLASGAQNWLPDLPDP